MASNGVTSPNGGSKKRPIAKRPSEHCQDVRAHLQATGLLDESTCRRCGLVYDAAMQGHRGPPDHPEKPERIAEIWRQLESSGLVEACAQVPSREASDAELLHVHSEHHISMVSKHGGNALGGNSKKLKKSGSQSGSFAFPFGPDTYVCDKTCQAARLAAGSTLNLIDATFKVDSAIHCGMAVVRPPGHHATADKAQGFCLFNNVAAAARHLQKEHGVEKVMIVDWDVHHGDGTSDIFKDDNSVLFFSCHRYDDKGLAFFPGTGVTEDFGQKSGSGYTINVPLRKGYRDVDICYVAKHVLIPLAERFKPGAIIVSAGFDAVQDDPLGKCSMTPQGYGWLTRCLYGIARDLCEGRIYLVLEGGYNCEQMGRCAVECVGTLALAVAGKSQMDSLDWLPVVPSVTVKEGLLSPLLRPLSPPSKPAAPPIEAESKHVPQWKTAYTVRKLTELHGNLKLGLPLAPKAPKRPDSLQGTQSRKNGKRKNDKSNARKADANGADSGVTQEVDSSGDSEPEEQSGAQPYLWPQAQNSKVSGDSGWLSYLRQCNPVLMVAATLFVLWGLSIYQRWQPQNAASGVGSFPSEAMPGQKSPSPSVKMPSKSRPDSKRYPPLSSEDTLVIKMLIHGVYERRNPAKLNELPGLLKRYRGRERQVYEHVCRKYGEIPEPIGLPHSSGSKRKTEKTQVPEVLPYYIRHTPHTNTELQVVVRVAKTVRAKDVHVKILDDYLGVMIQGEAPIIDGRLAVRIKARKSFWELDEEDNGSRVLIITLAKRKSSDVFDRLIIPDTAMPFVAPSQPQSVPKAPDPPDKANSNITNELPLDPPKYNLLPGKNPSEVKVELEVPDSTKISDLDITITDTKLKVSVKGTQLIGGKLSNKVKGKRSSWKLTKRKGVTIVVLSLVKKMKSDSFLTLFVPDPAEDAKNAAWPASEDASENSDLKSIDDAKYAAWGEHQDSATQGERENAKATHEHDRLLGQVTDDLPPLPGYEEFTEGWGQAIPVDQEAEDPTEVDLPPLPGSMKAASSAATLYNQGGATGGHLYRPYPEEGIAKDDEVRSSSEPLPKHQQERVGHSKSARVFNAEPSVSDEAARLRQLIQGVYERRNPDKLRELGALLDRHRGRERQVYEHVCRKYGETPEPVMSGVDQGDPKDVSSWVSSLLR